jgi:hypothetical protein
MQTARTRGQSRSARELAEADSSVCPHCGALSKTVSDGICADCWGVKDPENALDFRPAPKTEPLFDWNLDWLGIPLVGHVAVAAGLVAALAFAVVEFLF